MNLFNLFENQNTTNPEVVDEKMGSSLVNKRQAHAYITSFKKPKFNIEEEDEFNIFDIGDKVLFKGHSAEVIEIDGTAATIRVPNWKAVSGMVDDITEVDPASHFLKPITNGVSEAGYAGADDTDTVGFHLDTERAYQAVMGRYGDMIDQDETSGIMYVPARLWPRIEMIAFDADGIGALRDDDLENPEHYGVAEAGMSDQHKENHLAAVRAYHARKKAEKEQRSADSRGAFNSWMGGSPEDLTKFMNIRKKDVAEGRLELDRKTGQMRHNNDDPDQRHGLYINGKLVKTYGSREQAENVKKRDAKFKDATIKKIAETKHDAMSTPEFKKALDFVQRNAKPVDSVKLKQRMDAAERAEQDRENRKKERRGEVTEIKTPKIQKIRPGATKEDTYNGWDLRYHLRPKEGEKEFKGMAVHSKSAKTTPIHVVGTSPEDVLAKLKTAIDTSRGNNEIKSARVMVDFNAQLARDIIGHGGDIYAEIINHDGKPMLLLSSEDQGGMARAQDRTALANRRPDRIGQQAFGMSGVAAKAAGLTHARYSLGQPVEYVPGVIALPLEFRSEVYPGEVVKMGEPGVTIAHPRNVAEDGTADQMSQDTASIAQAQRQRWEAEQRAKQQPAPTAPAPTPAATTPVAPAPQATPDQIANHPQYKMWYNRFYRKEQQDRPGSPGNAAEAKRYTDAKIKGLIQQGTDPNDPGPEPTWVKNLPAPTKSAPPASAPNTKQAPFESTGPKFGGYYKGTQKGAPRPGQGFGSMEEGIAGNMTARSDALTNLKEPDDLKLKQADPFKGNPHRNNLVSAQARNLVAKGAQTAGPGTGAHKNTALAVKKGDFRKLKHKGSFDFSESTNFLAWATASGYNVIGNPALYESAKYEYNLLLKQAKETGENK